MTQMEGGPDGRGPRGRDNFEKESKDNLTLPGPRGWFSHSFYFFRDNFFLNIFFKKSYIEKNYTAVLNILSP